MKFKKIKGSQNHHLFLPFDQKGELRDVYWVRFFKAGKGRLEGSLKTNILGDARIARDRRIAEFLGERPRWAGKGVVVGDKFPEFLELKRGKAKATFDSIHNQWVHHLEPYFGSKLVDEVTESEWLRYVADSRAKDGQADRKFFNDRKYLSMFLNWLHRDGVIAKIPKLPNVDPERDAGIVYSNSEIESLLQASNEVLADQIILALTMGMRHGEIWSLEWDQIDWKKRTIHLPAAKTKIRRARTFVMSEDGEIVLKARHKARVSTWVFPHPDNTSKPAGRFGEKSAWDRVRDLAGVTGSFHDLRHTFLTRAFKTSTNPALICTYAGLSLEEAYRTYLHFTPEDTKVVSGLVTLGSWR